MNLTLTGNAVRLYVFVDDLQNSSKKPITVFVSKYKTIHNLRHEFSEKLNYAPQEQHWILNKMYCYDKYLIGDVIRDALPFRKGFLTFLFILSETEKNNILEYFGDFIVRRYLHVLPEHRWKDHTGECGNVIVIADIVDRPTNDDARWKCNSCTLFNKAFLKCCDLCGSARPDSFIIPRDYFFTKEDRNRFLEQMAIEEKADKLEQESIMKMEREKMKNFEKLNDLYKLDLIYTIEVTDCPICGMECQPGEAVILRNCFHTLCKDCLRNYIKNVPDPKIKCFDPNCSGFVESREIKDVLDAEEFEDYLQLSLRTAESRIENTFHCKTPDCTAWAIYDDNVNFFLCPICKHENCLLCVTIHEGKTCKEYQDELAIKARNDEAAKKDLAFLENMIQTGQAMKCPGCQIIIQKKGGCDGMRCNMCNIEICWATKGPRWGPKGKGDTSGGCRCGVGGKRCHPACKHCH